MNPSDWVSRERSAPSWTNFAVSERPTVGAPNPTDTLAYIEIAISLRPWPQVIGRPGAKPGCERKQKPRRFARTQALTETVFFGFLNLSV